ncbi:hypothetical protein ACFL6C_03530 [Myxococcota bacterium]
MRGLLALGMLSLIAIAGCKEAKGSPPAGCGNPGQVVWVDAAGTCVAGVVATSELHFDQKNFFDETGYIWNVDVQSGEVHPCYHRDLWFQSSDCTGTAYVSPTPPRVTFLAGNAPPTRVLPDDAQRTVVEIQYRQGYPGGCEEVSVDPMPMVPAELTVPDTPIEVPTLPYQFPIHPELVR